MGIIYTKSEIIQKCEDAFKDIPTFYRAEFVKYTGITRDTKELYTEIIAEFLLDKMKEINAFFSDYMISRERSYFTKTHDGHYNSTSNHIEEITAMQLFNQCKNGAALEHIGSVIDYQTPLKNSHEKSAGKIDLLSVNHQTKTIYILELKRSNAKKPETMLKCVLEAYTYLQIVNGDKLKKDFDLPNDYTLQANPLVFHGDVQWQEMQENRPALKRLMHLLNSKPYFLSLKDGKYIVTEV